MASSADYLLPPQTRLDRFGSFLKEELGPYPGRIATVARIVVACVVTMLLVMIFKLPNGFLAAFYALAISRLDPQSIVRNGFNIVVGNIAGLAVALAGIVLFSDYPLFHFLFIVGSCFLAFFAAATLVNYATAFGFGIILIAAASVNIIWTHPGQPAPDVQTTILTSFGIILGSIVTVLTEYLLAFNGRVAEGPSKLQRIFVTDAFSNPNYVAFALKGCLAASICYIVWSALAWPGLGVCTVTCLIAAPLGTPGSSRQRLITRLSGLFVGGVVCGIGSQIFILPTVDSIVGFTLAFAAISAVAAWFATSSPRLNYFGRQMALAYYLTIFQGFGPNTSLSVSRDRLMGIFLGLLVTWMVFDSKS